MPRPSVCIVSPARSADNNGNWRTADRWRAHLQSMADVEIVQQWEGQPADVLIALHARRSAPSIERFHTQMPGRPIALVLTGTDVYGDLESDASAQLSLQLADRVVGLQPLALQRLDAASRQKAVAIVQGAEPRRREHAQGTFVAVGHLRAEKDPLTLMRAVPRLRPDVQVLHIGIALDEAFAEQARALMANSAQYRWMGSLDHEQVREHIARATALVHMSRLEGGANVVIEAIVSGTPVIASRIDGNVGLLGASYDAYFDAGDDVALAALIRRCATDPGFTDQLRRHCVALAPGYTADAECERVRRLLSDCLALRDTGAIVTAKKDTHP